MNPWFIHLLSNFREFSSDNCHDKSILLSFAKIEQIISLICISLVSTEKEAMSLSQCELHPLSHLLSEDHATMLQIESMRSSDWNQRANQRYKTVKSSTFFSLPYLLSFLVLSNKQVAIRFQFTNLRFDQIILILPPLILLNIFQNFV